MGRTAPRAPTTRPVGPAGLLQVPGPARPPPRRPDARDRAGPQTATSTARLTTRTRSARSSPARTTSATGICVRLLLDYGLRKGALLGRPVQALRPRPQAADDLHQGRQGPRRPDPGPAVLARPRAAHPRHRAPSPTTTCSTASPSAPTASPARRRSSASSRRSRWASTARTTGGTGASTRAGIVAEGTTRGERMHKARHTAGQRVLDQTGNLKAVQKLLGHTSIQTTGDVYADWDDASWRRRWRTSCARPRDR